MNVAVTAVGGGVGQSILKALRGSKYSTIGIDPDPNAFGLYYADKGYLGERCDSKNYIRSIIKICKKENCHILFPGLDSELSLLSSNYLELQREGVTPIVSDLKTLELSNDKYKLYKFLEKAGIQRIETALSMGEVKDLKLEYPLIGKPRVGGCRSKLVERIENHFELSKYCSENKNNFIIQELIEGEEFTCGSVTFYKKVFGVIVMRRVLRDGDTYKAYVVKNKMIDKFLYNVLPLIDPFGPCNIQIRVRNNIPYILEINARCSGTTGARALVGFNEPKMVCDFLNEKKVTHNIKEAAILRYWNECIVSYEDLKGLKNEGSIDGRRGIIRS